MLARLLLVAALQPAVDSFADRYLLDLGILVLTYVMLGWGLNIVVGLAGLLDLGYVAFYAVGAYTFGLLAHTLRARLLGLPAARRHDGRRFGVVLGFPVLRLRGDYLAIVTLGFGEIIRIVLLNWAGLTNGPNGIGGIPRPSFFGLPFTDAPGGHGTFADSSACPTAPRSASIFLYFVILGLALLTNLVHAAHPPPADRPRLGGAARGRDRLPALGINPTNIKLTAFAIGAMFGGLAGAFFAARQGFISPESFTFIESAIILAIVVLGGMGSQLGVVLAAVV